MTTSVILALATGLPVIATKHSAFPDQVLDGKNGYLANENDYKDLAEKLLQYLEHPELWRDMSRVARAHALATYDQKVLIGKQISHYERLAPGVKEVAFVVSTFPVTSETWLINQIADLIERGIDVRLYAFKKGTEENISQRYFDHKMKDRTVYLEMPENLLARFFVAIPKFFHMLFVKPRALLSVFSVREHGANAYSGKLLFWTEPFLDLTADLIHCHFGTVANRFLAIRDALRLPQPFLTSFYGYDVSSVPQQKGAGYYDRLIKECPFFIVMSNNMKDRVAKLGFSREKMDPVPISEDVESFPYKERVLEKDEKIRIVTVGRFVEKKGFDDLVRAMAIVKQKLGRPFVCAIIGGGELEGELRALAKELDVEDVVSFEGFMKVQDVVQFLMKSHLYIQPSKTAKNGDME